jgi:hypothetical protein
MARLVCIPTSLAPRHSGRALGLVSIHRLVCIVVSIALLVTFGGCVSRKPCPDGFCAALPPTPEMATGVWVGFDESDLVFYRLDLRRDFTGYCASVSQTGSLHDYGVDVYKVTRWCLRDRTLLIDMHPVTTNAEAIYLKGTFGGSPIELEVGGSNGQWKRDVVLHRESEWNAGNSETRSKIHEVENK